MSGEKSIEEYEALLEEKDKELMVLNNMVNLLATIIEKTLTNKLDEIETLEGIVEIMENIEGTLKDLEGMEDDIEDK